MCASVFIDVSFAFGLIFTLRLSAGDEDAKVENAVRALGGSVDRYDTGESKPIVRVDLRGGKGVSDLSLKELAGLKSLQLLDISENRITDAGLKEIAAHKRLKGLWLRGTRVSDADVSIKLRCTLVQVIYRRRTLGIAPAFGRP